MSHAYKVLAAEGWVHYTSAAAEASYDRARISLMYLTQTSEIIKWNLKVCLIEMYAFK